MSDDFSTMSRQEVLSKDGRRELFNSHPLITGSVLLPTAPIREVATMARKSCLLRESGLVFIGKSGVGKSAALEMIESILREQFPRVAIYRHDTHNQTIPSIRAFFKHFLSTVGCQNVRGETYDLRSLLVNTLIDSARLHGERMILLLVDEANAMGVVDFNFLKDVYNDLAKENVKLVTILIGQDPEFSQLVAKFIRMQRLDLIGRFAIRVVPFRGYRSHQDLVEIFQGIDEEVFPPGTGVTWTEFFFPLAYAAGFRLKNEASSFLNAVEALKPAGLKVGSEIPARQMFSAVRSFLTDLVLFDEAGMIVPEGAWESAIRYAALTEAMAHMSARKGAVKIKT
jgi:energy-coupling factor transporter ATP-binding protein EcfA2